MYALYSLLSFVVLLLASPYWLYQAVRHRKYVSSLRQRLGHLPLTFNVDGDPSIWIHAVSVGETLTTRALLADLRVRFPGLKIFLSTTTRTGQQVAKNLPDVDGIFYFPFDWAFTLRRTLGIVRPRLFVMMETEIWPNLLRVCRATGVRTALVNGRVSQRSFSRYRLVAPFFRRVLGDIDCFCMQSEAAARRIIDLGAPADRVTVTGSLKFDSLDWPAVGPHGQSRDRVLRYFRLPDERPVVIAASTLRGEDAAALNAFRRVKARWPDALLIIAPRHPERFDEVTKLVAEEGFSVTRRSALAVDAGPATDVVVLDTIGELARLYQIATVVFVGGSIVDAGGHNIIEPAMFGKPIVFGPHMQNFAEISEVFLANHAATQVHSTGELDQAIVDLLADPVRRASLGAAARALVEANRGAKARTIEAIAQLLPSKGPRGHHASRQLRLVR